MIRRRRDEMSEADAWALIGLGVVVLVLGLCSLPGHAAQHTTTAPPVTLTNTDTGEHIILTAAITWRDPLWDRPVYAVNAIRVYTDPATGERIVWIDPTLQGVRTVRIERGIRLVETFDVQAASVLPSQPRNGIDKPVYLAQPEQLGAVTTVEAIPGTFEAVTPQVSGDVWDVEKRD